MTEEIISCAEAGEGTLGEGEQKTQSKKRKPWTGNDWVLIGMASLSVVFLAVFAYAPLYGLVLAFKDGDGWLNISQAISVAKWCGFDNFTAFFDEGITEEQIQAIGDKIEKRAEVASYNYVSAEQAWEDFKKVYFQGAEDLADGFAEDNPLANSAHYEIYLNDVSMQDALVTYLQSLDGIRKVNQSEVAANTLSDFNSLVSYISIGIIMILLAVSTFLISNTVTIGISVRKEEIGIMKLIGATDFFVRAPFVVEGVLIGLIGSALPLALLYVLYSKVVVYIAGKFSFLSNMMNFLPVNEVFRTLVPVALILGVGIGFMGSRITIHKHLRV